MQKKALIHFSDASLIGIHALANLHRNSQRLVQTQELAKELDASIHHVAKVMQRLVRTGLINSTKGPQGGFSLARPPASISLLHIIEAIEGPVGTKYCTFRTETCSPETRILGKEVANYAEKLKEHLGRRTLETIEITQNGTGGT